MSKQINVVETFNINRIQRIYGKNPYPGEIEERLRRTFKKYQDGEQMAIRF